MTLPVTIGSAPRPTTMIPIPADAGPFAPDGWSGATPRTPHAILRQPVRRQSYCETHICGIDRYRLFTGRRPGRSDSPIRDFASDEEV